MTTTTQPMNVELVCAEDGAKRLVLPVGETVLGRGYPGTGITDPRCSRQQLAIEVSGDGQRATVTVRGANTSAVVSGETGARTVLSKGDSRELRDGDIVELLVDAHRYRFHAHKPVVPPQQKTKATTTTAQRPSDASAQPVKVTAPAMVLSLGSVDPTTADGANAAAQGTTTAAAAGNRPKCKYWDKCYRTNPEHLAAFMHPKDVVFSSPAAVQSEQQQPPKDQPTPPAPLASPATSPANGGVFVAPQNQPKPKGTPRAAAAAASSSSVPRPEGWAKLAMSSLATGTLHYDADEAAKIACAVVQSFLDRARDVPEAGVILAESDPRVRAAFERHRGADERFVITPFSATTPRSDGIQCASVAVEVNWRWKPSDPHTDIALNGAGIPATIKQRHPATAQVGHVYHCHVAADSKLCTDEGVHDVFLCVPPNVGNPSKPDIVSDPSEARELLAATYRTLFDAFWGHVKSKQ